MAKIPDRDARNRARAARRKGKLRAKRRRQRARASGGPLRKTCDIVGPNPRQLTRLAR